MEKKRFQVKPNSTVVDHDFYCTFTYLLRTAENYQFQGSVALAKGLKLPRTETFNRIKINTERVLTQPAAFGWEETYNGHKIIVAPAKADPYTLFKCAAQILIEEERFGKNPLKTLPPTDKQISDFLRGVHNEAYRHVGVDFRPNIKEY